MQWQFWKKRQPVVDKPQNPPSTDEPRVGQFGENSKYRESWQCPQTRVIEFDERHDIFVVRIGEYATRIIGAPPSDSWHFNTAISLIEGAAVAWTSPVSALFGDGFIDGTCEVNEFHLTPSYANVVALRVTGFDWTSLAEKIALEFKIDEVAVLTAKQALDNERNRVKGQAFEFLQRAREEWRSILSREDDTDG